MNKAIKQVFVFVFFLFMVHRGSAAGFWGRLAEMMAPSQDYFAELKEGSHFFDNKNLKITKKAWDMHEESMKKALKNLEERQENSDATLSFVDSEGATLAHYAAQALNIELLIFLKDKEKDLERLGKKDLFFQKNNKGKVPFIELMRTYALFEEHAEKVVKKEEDRLILLQGFIADLITENKEYLGSIIDGQGKTLLYNALELENIFCIRSLLDAGLAPMTVQGKNLLAFVIDKERFESFKVLLENETSKALTIQLIFQADASQGKTPFEMLVEKKNYGMGYFLLKNQEALSELKKYWEQKEKQFEGGDGQKSEAMKKFVGKDDKGIFQESKKKEERFLYAIASEHLDNEAFIGQLKMAGLISYDPNTQGDSLLFVAVADKDVDQVKKMLPYCSADAVITPNLKEGLAPEVYGQTPLHLAAFLGNTEILMLLLQKEGVLEKSEVKNSRGENFLHVLVKNFYKNVKKECDEGTFMPEPLYLLRKGIKRNKEDIRNIDQMRSNMQQALAQYLARQERRFGLQR